MLCAINTNDLFFYVKLLKHVHVFQPSTARSTKLLSSTCIPELFTQLSIPNLKTDDERLMQLAKCCQEYIKTSLGIAACAINTDQIFFNFFLKKES